MHPECWPIPVPRNDPYFPALNISSGRPHCIAFTRSLPGQQRLGPREQLNQNTAFVDASQIYGQVDSRYSGRRHSSVENRYHRYHHIEQIEVLLIVLLSGYLPSRQFAGVCWRAAEHDCPGARARQDDDAHHQDQQGVQGRVGEVLRGRGHPRQRAARPRRHAHHLPQGAQ